MTGRPTVGQKRSCACWARAILNLPFRAPDYQGRPGGARSACCSARPCCRPAPACSRASASSPTRSAAPPRPRLSRPARRNRPTTAGTGGVKVAVILPLSAAGNAGLAAQSMRNAAEMALAEFQNPEHPAPDQGRQRQPARRAGGRAAGGRRRRRDHPGPAVRAVGAGGGAGRAHARHLGDRVLDRFQHRRPRRLSAELPAGVRRQPHRRIFRQHRKTLRSPCSCPTMPMAMSSRPR